MARISLGLSCAAALVGLTLAVGAQTADPQTAAPQPGPTPATESPVATPPSTSPAPSAAPPATLSPAEGASQGQGGTPPATAAPLEQPTAPQTPAGDASPAPEPVQATDAAATPPQPGPAEAAEAADLPAAPGAGDGAPGPSAGHSVTGGHDLSPLGMYLMADAVVKSVLILLGAASFLCWTVLVYKLVETGVARRRARHAARVLTGAASLQAALQALQGRRDPAAFMVQAVAEEFRRSAAVLAPAGAEGIKERAVSLVQRVEVQASSRLRRGMGLLATIGAVGPFVGLFGTVWGIMNSFIGIAESQTTNLAVVAPGIAEALFATAIGLVAAIPAVVIYNHFTRVIQGYKLVLGDAGAATLRLLSRDIDFRHLEG